jgi:protein-S-isoprenylcysteine O-methyltransferase Ste14
MRHGPSSDGTMQNTAAEQGTMPTVGVHAVAHHQEQAAVPPRDWFRRAVIVVVVLVWATGALIQAFGGRYVEPWWVHAIALITISVALTGEFQATRDLFRSSR